MRFVPQIKGIAAVHTSLKAYGVEAFRREAMAVKQVWGPGGLGVCRCQQRMGGLALPGCVCCCQRMGGLALPGCVCRCQCMGGLALPGCVCRCQRMGGLALPGCVCRCQRMGGQIHHMGVRLLPADVCTLKGVRQGWRCHHGPMLCCCCWCVHLDGEALVRHSACAHTHAQSCLAWRSVRCTARSMHCPVYALHCPRALCSACNVHMRHDACQQDLLLNLGLHRRPDHSSSAWKSS